MGNHSEVKKGSRHSVTFTREPFQDLSSSVTNLKLPHADSASSTSSVQSGKPRGTVRHIYHGQTTQRTKPNLTCRSAKLNAAPSKDLLSNNASGGRPRQVSRTQSSHPSQPKPRKQETTKQTVTQPPKLSSQPLRSSSLPTREARTT